MEHFTPNFLSSVESFAVANGEDKKSKAIGIIDVLKENYSKFVTKKEILVVVINDNFRIEFMNDNLCGSLYRPAHTVQGESIFSIVDGKSNDNIKAVVNAIQSKPGGRHSIKDLTMYCSYNHEYYFDGMAINLKDDARVGGYLFYLHNVSDRRRTEIKLKDLSLELDSFVYKASHDLRAPLTSLAGLINITEMDFPQTAKENFDMMKRSVERLDKFIRQLAHYSRNNSTESERGEIDFRELVREIIENHAHLKGADKIHFDVIKDFEEPILSDRFRLTAVLSNLISNAIKYHRVDQEYPFVKILGTRKDSSILISVEDNGIGIRENHIGTVFDMFKRATDHSDGSGLGLYIVKKALERLDGKIIVESKYEEGTRFTVTLPG